MADSPIYSVSVNNPSNDVTAAITGEITFRRVGPKNLGSGVLNNLPVPHTNNQTGRIVEDNTGSVSIDGSPSSAADYEVLADEILSLLKTIVENKYGVGLDLIKEEKADDLVIEDDEVVIEEEEVIEEPEPDLIEEEEEPEYVFTPPDTVQTPTAPPTAANTKNRIYQVFEHTIELDELSLPGDEESLTQKAISQASLEYPLIKINDYMLANTEIDSMTINSTEVIPTISLKCTFKHQLFISKDMPKDGDIISVAIRNKSDSLKIIRNDYVITGAVSSTNSTSGGGPVTLTFFGKLFIPWGDSEKINLSYEGTSYSMLKDLAQRLGLGFATNEDDTDDKQIWLSGYGRISDYIGNTVDRAWKDENSFFDIWVDVYYNLNFVNINKQLMSGEDEVDAGVWLNNVDSDFTYGEHTNQDETKLTSKVLSNYEGYKSSSFYIKSWKPNNKSTKITHEYGTKVNCNMFEHNANLYQNDEAEKYWSVGVEPVYDPDKVDKYILLRGRATQRPELRGSDLAQANYNYTDIYETNPWMGIQYTISNPEDDNLKWDGNHHKNYLRARVQNILNRKELDKLNVEVNVTGLNTNLIRGDKTPIVLIRTDRGENNVINSEAEGMDLLDQFYSGWYLVKGFLINYAHDNDESTLSNFTQKFVLTRREWPPPIAVKAVNDTNT